MRRVLTVVAAIAYVFVAAGLLTRALSAMPQGNVAESLLYAGGPFWELSIVLAPIAIREGRSTGSLLSFLLKYVGLVYVGVLGQWVIGGALLAFDAPPALVIAWQVQAINSFAFLGLFAMCNLPLTFVIWIVARLSGGHRERLL